MTIHEAHQMFYSVYMREGLVAGVEDFRDWWKVWCSGHEM